MQHQHHHRMRELVRLPSNKKTSMKARMVHDIAVAVLDTVQDLTMPELLKSQWGPAGGFLPKRVNQEAGQAFDKASRVFFNDELLPSSPAVQGGAAASVLERAFERGLATGINALEDVAATGSKGARRGYQLMRGHAQTMALRGGLRRQKTSGNQPTTPSLPPSQLETQLQAAIDRERGGAGFVAQAPTPSLQEILEQERRLHEQELQQVRASAMEVVQEQTADARLMLEQAIDDMQKDKVRSAKVEQNLKHKVASLSTRVSEAVGTAASNSIQAQYTSMFRMRKAKILDRLLHNVKQDPKVAKRFSERPTLREVAFADSIDPLGEWIASVMFHTPMQICVHLLKDPMNWVDQIPNANVLARLVHTLYTHVIAVVKEFFSPSQKKKGQPAATTNPHAAAVKF